LEMPPPTQGVAALEGLALLERGASPETAIRLALQDALARVRDGADVFALFGSGVVVGDTGIVLQNRGGCFGVQGAVVPGARPYHTIIPGLLLRDGGLLGPFGIVGGFLQAQAHVQFVSSVADDDLDPQAALDRPRFRVDGDRVVAEPEADFAEFGAGQAILVDGDALVGGSDSRADGVALGL